MPSAMGTLSCLDDNILLTAKKKYKKSSAKREIATQQRTQEIMLDSNRPKWMEQSTGVRLCN